MKLFRKRLVPSSSDPEIPGLTELAAARGWRPIDEDQPMESQIADQVHRMSWILYDRAYSTALYDTTSVEHRTFYANSFAGDLDGRRLVVANVWTNIGPQQLVKLHEMRGVAVCVLERCTLPPFVIQPRHLPEAERHMKPTPTGDPEFDERFIAIFPIVDTVSALLTPAVRQRILAHDDWVFVCMSGSLLCAGTGAFESADAVGTRVDEVLGIVGAFAAAIAPGPIDPATDELIARIGRISSLEEAVTFLLSLGPDERELLARSGTPIAAFADVTTAEETLARYQSLTLAQKMAVLAMMRITDEG